MQEVEGFLNGTTDYYLLKGDTGPLVYVSIHLLTYIFWLNCQTLPLQARGVSSIMPYAGLFC